MSVTRLLLLVIRAQHDDRSAILAGYLLPKVSSASLQNWTPRTAPYATFKSLPRSTPAIPVDLCSTNLVRLLVSTYKSHSLLCLLLIHQPLRVWDWSVYPFVRQSPGQYFPTNCLLKWSVCIFHSRQSAPSQAHLRQN